MKIYRVVIDNYRNLKKIDVTLNNIVTLIGENNSGKSNFLRALSIPLLSDDSGNSKRLSWYDINRDAKESYYSFLSDNKASIIDGSLSVEQFLPALPEVKIILYLQSNENEHYNVSEILCENEAEEWIGGICYRFYVKKPEELLERVRHILSSDSYNERTKMSLLPMEVFSFSITIPGKEKSISYETLARFRSVELPAERDSFASNSDKLGSKALSDLLQKGLTADSQVKIEEKYTEFFDTIREEGKLDSVLNWQDYSEIPNAQKFFQEISILPNMPQMSSIIGSVRLGYENDNMFAQGLGHRNLVLMSVILNSYINKERDISFRLMTIEEPEAHLCSSNIQLMISLISIFGKKNSYTQIVYSTHNAEFVNKIGIDNVLVFHNGVAFNLGKELTDTERDYLTANPNTDIFKLFYSRKAVLVEGITEELLIKSYFQTRTDLSEIKVISFHKGFTKIIDIWKKINIGTKNRLGIVRDSDDQPKAQADHEKRQNEQVIVRTTKGYTLETDIVNSNYELLRSKYGEEYGWSAMTADEIQQDWRDNRKSDFMLRICHDMLNGELNAFVLPPHIQQIVDFMQGDSNDC